MNTLYYGDNLKILRVFPGPPRRELRREDLIRDYVKGALTQIEVAKKYGTSTNVVRRDLKRYGIERVILSTYDGDGDYGLIDSATATTEAFARFHICLVMKYSRWECTFLYSIIK